MKGFENVVDFERISHAIHDLSKVVHLIQERKCFKRFFEIRNLSKFFWKSAAILQHYDFSKLWYLIECGFLHHITLCDAKYSWHEHRNHTK